MAKHTKAGSDRNKQLLASFKQYQASVDKDIAAVKDTIAEAVKEGGITESTVEALAAIFRGYEYIKPIADTAWERYYDHCEAFDYEVQA
jgi:hypothetical protein